MTAAARVEYELVPRDQVDLDILRAIHDDFARASAFDHPAFKCAAEDVVEPGLVGHEPQRLRHDVGGLLISRCAWVSLRVGAAVALDAEDAVNLALDAVEDDRRLPALLQRGDFLTGPLLAVVIVARKGRAVARFLHRVQIFAHHLPNALGAVLARLGLGRHAYNTRQLSAFGGGL